MKKDVGVAVLVAVVGVGATAGYFALSETARNAAIVIGAFALIPLGAYAFGALMSLRQAVLLAIACACVGGSILYFGQSAPAARGAEAASR